MPLPLRVRNIVGLSKHSNPGASGAAESAFSPAVKIASSFGERGPAPMDSQHEQQEPQQQHEQQQQQQQQQQPQQERHPQHLDASKLAISSPRRPKRANMDVHEPSPRMQPQFAEENAKTRQRQIYASSPHLARQTERPVAPNTTQTTTTTTKPSDQNSNNQPAPTNTDSTDAHSPKSLPRTTTDRTTSGSAPATRPSSPAQRRKVLPREFFKCDYADLLVLISSMLSELVKLNDSLPLVQSQLTRFHSRAPPAISHRDYLHRLIRFCSLEKATLLSMVFYIDLLCAAFSAFTISSLTVHRFLITAATVASKGLCDSFCTNSHYAKVGGVSLAELNLLEVEFLVRVGWRVVPAVQTLDEYYRRMVARMDDVYTLDTDTESEDEQVTPQEPSRSQ
ncbi:cyclin-domain-containing protein [Myxozyma melibiosi]|uniref:Cyclin-domain-containing protein n=1 Tax=Myxozyma melibiosi TaxID=54550 RepID=A0ABR1FC11_9ASCO